jgi:RHS repeat-associated protein
MTRMQDRYAFFFAARSFSVSQIQRSFVLVFAAALCLCSRPARAQYYSPASGISSTPIPGAGHNYLDGMVDTVNPADGSVSIRVKTPIPAGRGIKIPFSFNYDSSGIWQPFNQNTYTAKLWTPPNNATLGGWAYGVPSLNWNEVEVAGLEKGTCVDYTAYMFTDAAGTRHTIYADWIPGSESNCGNNTNDGGDVQFQAHIVNSTGTTYVAGASGTTYTFSPSGNCPSYPTMIEDTNGNQITFSCGSSGSGSVQDTLGRSAISWSGFGSNTDTITVSGLQAAYQLTWGTTPYNFANIPSGGIGSQLSYSYGGCGGFSTTNGTLNVVTNLSLPDGTAFSFSYDPDYGLLNKVEYPSGAYVVYTWENNPLAAYFYSTGAVSGHEYICGWDYDTFAVAHRYLYNPQGTLILQQDFSYSTNWSSSSAWKTTSVTTTDKITGQVSTTSYTYSEFTLPNVPLEASLQIAPEVPLESQVVYKDGSGNTLRTESKWYTNPFEMTREQVMLDTGATSETDYTYGSGAQVTEKDEYDYGSSGNPGTPGSLLRKTITQYQSFGDTPLYTFGATIFDRPCEVATYDGSGNLYAETDTFYDNESTGTVCGTVGTPSVSSAGGSTVTAHDVTNYGVSSTYPRGNATTVIKKCFPTSSCPAGNSQITYSYDETGQRVSSTSPCGNGTCSDIPGATQSNQTTTYTYSDSYLSTNTGTYTTTAGSPPSGKVTNAYLTKITNGLGQVETFTYGYNDGEMTSASDANTPPNVTTYRYNDNFGRLNETDYPDTGKTTLQYNDAGVAPSVTTTKALTSNTNITSTAITDGMGHTVQTQLTSDPDGTTYTATVLDGLFRAYQTYNPTRCTPPSTCPAETTWGYSTSSYDILNRVIQVTRPDGSVTTTTYSGYCYTVTDEVGSQRTTCTDALGRITSVTEAPSSYDFLTTYTYDPLNDLLKVTQNGSNSSLARIRTFSYDSLTRLLSATNPELSGNTIQYSYDLNGNLASRVAPKPTPGSSGSVTTNYSYDVLNRLIQKSYTGMATPTAQYAYDGTALSGCTYAPPSISSPTNLVGRRSSMCYSRSSSSFSYDSMGRVLFDKRLNYGTSAATLITGYTYYLEGSLNTLSYPSVSYPSSELVTYTVGQAERVTQVSDSSNNYVYYSSALGSPEYAPNGSVANVVNGHTSSTGIAISNIYNDRLQPILLSASVSSGPVFSLCYDFHLHQAISTGPCNLSAYSTGDNGNVFQMLNNIDSTRSAVFQYDALNRLSQAGTVNTTSGNCWAESYTIDSWSNLTNRTGVSGYSGTCTTEPLSTTASTNNQLAIFSYDAAGNVTNDGNGNQPTYDAENRIITDQGVTYSYDADGFRMEKSSGTMYWPGLGGEVLAETNLSGTINEEYVFFDGERIARVDQPSGTVHYYFSDHLGSAAVITNADGTGPTYYYYFPYGGMAGTSGSDPNHYKFTGKERDSESNLDNFGARFYTSGIGRFMTPDWAAKPTAVPYAVFGDPQTLNLYAYVENAPVNRADADGHGFSAGWQYMLNGHGGFGDEMIITMDELSTGDEQGNNQTGSQQATQQVQRPPQQTAQSATPAQNNNQSSGGFWQKLGNLAKGHGWKTNAEVAKDPTQVSVVGAKTSDYRGAGTVKGVLNQFHSAVVGMDKSDMRRTGSGEANGEINDAQHWTNGYYGCQDQAYMAQTLLSGQHNGYSFIVQGEDPDPLLGGAYHNYEVVGFPDNPGNPTLFLSPWLNSATVVVPPQ